MELSAEKKPRSPWRNKQHHHSKRWRGVRKETKCEVFNASKFYPQWPGSQQNLHCNGLHLCTLALAADNFRQMKRVYKLCIICHCCTLICVHPAGKDVRAQNASCSPNARAPGICWVPIKFRLHDVWIIPDEISSGNGFRLTHDLRRFKATVNCFLNCSLNVTYVQGGAEQRLVFENLICQKSCQHAHGLLEVKKMSRVLQCPRLHGIKPEDSLFTCFCLRQQLAGLWLSLRRIYASKGKEVGQSYPHLYSWNPFLSHSRVVWPLLVNSWETWPCPRERVTSCFLASFATCKKETRMLGSIVSCLAAPTTGCRISMEAQSSFLGGIGFWGG